MVDPYRHTEWIAFRTRVIQLDGGRCVRCFRGRSDGVILQVHHRQYVSGRLPWEYPISDCETLCKGCHAEEHRHVMPQTGWHLVGSDDLGDLSGECELCGTYLRYTFAVIHPTWGSMMVGTNCCDKLTATDDASQHMDWFTKRRDRLARFVESNRWKKRNENVTVLQEADAAYRIEPHGPAFRIAVNGQLGLREYSSVLEARKHLFGIRESGEAAAFIARQRQKRLEGTIAPDRRP